jgi:diguanylate cyclase (GGDEF)-like protein
LGFAAAAREAAASIEARWLGASAVVLWSASGRPRAVSAGAAHDLETLDLNDESEVLDVAVRLATSASPDAQLGTAAHEDALVLPIAIDGVRYGALCLIGVRERPGSGDVALLNGFASLLATLRSGELERERLVHEADAFRREARTDPLTQLLNRRGFLLELNHHCEHSTDLDSGDILLLADIKGLKEANDRHGHTVGDQLLVDVADALRATASARDVLGRFGGDEFAVIVCDDSPAARAATYAADVQAHIDRLRRDRPMGLIVAFGQQSLAGVDTAAEALERADNAMYHRLA